MDMMWWIMNICAALLLGLVPAAIITLHLIYLIQYRSELIYKGVSSRKVRPNLQAAWEIVQKKQAAESGSALLVWRYGIPGVLLAITPFAGYLFLLNLGDTVGPVGDAIKYGAAGAYIYVLLTLGQRLFRRDISSAAVMWADVTLVLGPLLAGVLACLWRPGENTSVWTSGSIYFLAGLAPRTVASMVEEAFRRLLATATGSTVAQPRTLPITLIRGMTPQVVERLGEEGITDVFSLAMCEPTKLYRNTSFELRQILSWMDEALLIYFLPQNWQALEDEGITGCIDLAWYNDYTGPPDAAGGAGSSGRSNAIKALASRVNMVRARRITSLTG
jgi:hypothetical protein